MAGEATTNTKEKIKRNQNITGVEQGESTTPETTRPDGTRKIQVEQRPYRPKLDSVYVEQDFFPDEEDGLEILQKNSGKAVFRDTKELPPRKDIIMYNKEKHEKEFNESIKWEDCPIQLQPRLEKIIKDNWDVFATEGLKYPIRGFQFHIDTGAAKPISCKLPRYGPHESRVIKELAEGLQSNGVIENDDGPWGSMVVLAGKPNQDDKYWTDYIWRLCVSFRKLNTITRPFTYNALRCDDAVTDIGSSRYFIMMDMYWGYWQVLLHEDSRSKTAFFVPGGKKRFCRMAMGLGNSHPAYCSIFDRIKDEFDGKFKATISRRNLSSNTGAKNIVDDLLLHGDDLESVIQYFIQVLQTLSKYRVTINLKKCRFFTKKAVFVGVDVTPQGNQPSEDKFEAIRKMVRKPPLCTKMLRGIIGFMNFYSKWIVGFEVRIEPWRKIIDNCPSNDHQGEEDRIYLASVWTAEDTELLKTLTNEILEKPCLARPDYDRRFYVKTDWSCVGKGAALTQADPHDPAALAAEQAEIKGGPCLFEKTVTNLSLRLRPCEFLSRRSDDKEKHWHSYTGESSTAFWAFTKWKRVLLIREFTWITDCSGAKKFFEGEDVMTHYHQRLRQGLLRFCFTITHRNERMLPECDLLSRYYKWSQDLRDSDRKRKEETKGEEWEAVKANLAFPSIPFCNVAIQEKGNCDAPSTPLAAQCSISRVVWDFEAAFSTTDQALESLFMENMVSTEIESDDRWNNPVTHKINEEQVTATPFYPISGWERQPKTVPPDWIVINVLETWDEQVTTAYANLAAENIRTQRAKIFLFTVMGVTILRQLEEEILTKLPPEYKSVTLKVDALVQGASVQCDSVCSIIHQEAFQVEQILLDKTSPTPVAEVLELISPDRNWSPEWDELEVKDGLKTKNAQRFPTVAAYIENMLGTGSKKRTEWTPVFDVSGPAPRLSRTSEIEWKGFPFLIQDDRQDHSIRGVTVCETLSLLGVSARKVKIIAQQLDEESYPPLSNIVPAQVKEAVFSATKSIEDTETERRHPTKTKKDIGDTNLAQMPAALLNSPLGLPLPTLPSWRDAIELDRDLRRVKAILAKQQAYSPQGWDEKQYAEELRQNRLELEDDLIYKYEVSVRKTLRQLRTLVVPVGFRHIVIAACHASPMSGHTDAHKTLWRTAARFWWPVMTRDVTQAVNECAHCKVSNLTSHEAQQMLKTVLANAPFDVLACDVWKPGDMPSSLKPGKSRTCKNLLTALDIMTAFAITAHLQYETSDEVALALVTQVIAVVGLPKLIIIDQGSEFAGQLIEVCDVLNIKKHVVTKENHKAILSERFHRYLNKVQKIHAADCETFDDWLIGTTFGVYGWNSSPVDGTDIIRSYAAIGREFLFPIDVTLNGTTYTANNSNFGEMTQNHVEGAFPLLQRQRELLKILTEERRAHHRELKNKGKKQKVFATGDLVLVRVQVQTSSEKGPGKLQLQARGPYRVLSEASPNTYVIQKVPFDASSDKRPGKAYTESASRMEKLPSKLVIHHHTDGTDTRWACYRNAFVPTPLQHTLGVTDFGKFKQTVDAVPAYEKIDQLWEEILMEEESDDSSEGTYDGLFSDDSEDDEDSNNKGSLSVAPTAVAPADVTAVDQNKKRERDEENDERKSRRLRFGTNTSRAAHAKPKFTPPVTPTKPSPILKRIDTAILPPPPPAVASPVGRRTRSSSRERNEGMDRVTWTKIIEKITVSRDRLLFVWYKTPGTAIKKWYLVQARIDEHNIDRARRTGVVRLRWFVRHKSDSKSFPVEQCRYWPEVHKVLPNGNLGIMVLIRPAKVDNFLRRDERHLAYELDLNLREHLLHGPFNFALPRSVGDRSYVVSRTDWAAMITAAAMKNTDIGDIGTIKPL